MVAIDHEVVGLTTGTYIPSSNFEFKESSQRGGSLNRMEEFFPNHPNTPAISFDLNIFEFDDEGRLQVGNEEIQSETWETTIMESLNSSKRKADEELDEDKKRKKVKEDKR
ncbi:hypothetical protein J1N35_001868 [Gossypium stocksii]|uniref:Uncharacterized protein n=1 Tax=Gossypium stocksii TaxID=47602 RepID=A0A9D3WKP6_9ROSI|nr:hypothetical protein J1N35_001868 [Gossypium stocksii]